MTHDDERPALEPLPDEPRPRWASSPAPAPPFEAASAGGTAEGPAVPAAPRAPRGAPKWETAARERLRTAIRRFRKPLSDLHGRDANEGDTRLLVTDFLCEGLGFDKFTDLTTEYQVRGEYADYGVPATGCRSRSHSPLTSTCSQKAAPPTRPTNSST